MFKTLQIRLSAVVSIVVMCAVLTHTMRTTAYNLSTLSVAA